MRALLHLLPLLALIGAAGLPPAPAQADPVVPGEEHCVIEIATGDALNLRKGPNASTAILAKHPYGDCGIVITGECQGNWCPVEDGHVAGWAHRRYLATVSPALYCVADVAEDDVLNLRAFPSTTSKILAELDPHQCGIAFLPYRQGNWQKIRVDGYEGWASRRFLSGQ